MSSPVYDVIIGNIPNARDSIDPNLDWEQQYPQTSTNVNVEHSQVKENLQAVETRGQKAKRAVDPKPLKVMVPTSDMSPTEFLKRQKEDPSLVQYWDKVNKTQEAKYKFCTKNNFLVRTVGSQSETSKYRSRLVVPKLYRNNIMKLGHEGIMSGHLGISRTLEKYLLNSIGLIYKKISVTSVYHVTYVNVHCLREKCREYHLVRCL
jgi:hypothetical protein